MAFHGTCHHIGRREHVVIFLFLGNWESIRAKSHVANVFCHCTSGVGNRYYLADIVDNCSHTKNLAFAILNLRRLVYNGIVLNVVVYLVLVGVEIIDERDILGIFPLIEVVEAHFAVWRALVDLFLAFLHNIHRREHIFKWVQMNKAVGSALCHSLAKVALPIVIEAETGRVVAVESELVR